ncbi:aldehyde dehydrogenase family protein [Rhizobium sp. FY34]|uniref:aldehyde dehydrogenase family protein n=1 Tax=Rhizobium sp. FY34 TaxID=2562309 RepID=UPI0010C00070|nr:aldehyde dehydrogenase family protein [Rhizobium sp. FY34]
MSLSFDPDRLDLPRGHFIGGQYLPANGVMPMHRPSDAREYAACPVAPAEMVDQAVSVAKSTLAASGWATCPPRDRTRVLHRWADLIEAEAVTLARLEAFCSTRPVGQLIDGDIAVSAEQIRFFAEFADKQGSDLVPTGAASLGMIMSEPYGVVGAITPWNVPLSMAAWKLGPALAAGNAVVLKPSELTPYSTLFLAELSVRAGLPAGLINIVLGDGPTTGAAITGHPDIAKISFTGSTGAGSAIMQNIALTGIKPMTLELGGKSPQLVFADADLDLSANAIATSILSNAGQACVAGSRLIVEESVAEQVIAAIIARMKAVKAGPTWDETSSYSPIISQRQRARIDHLVQSSIAQGAECLTGGQAMDHAGHFYAPTLLSGVSQSSPAVQEEIFGPVLTVQTFREEDEAIALSDHPTYGLAAGLFTRDLSRALRLTQRLQAGTIWVNRYSRSRDHILPTGGYKQSGIGKDLGRDAYLANRKTKSVLINL